MSKASAAVKARSLYRSLLREATYLPDEAAQSYFRRWIVHRFHSASKSDPEGLPKARKALYRLQRANHGDSKALTWVLFNTYGRIGKRRRELIEILRAHADEHLVPEDDADVKRLLENRRTGVTLEEDKPPAVKTKLQALIDSHWQTELPTTTPKTLIRQNQPKIPDTNIWGRPTPLKLRAGLERRWWAATLDKLLPPLPRDEHERLSELAMGNTLFRGPPQRRANPSPQPAELISQKQIARFLHPIEHVEKLPLEESKEIHKITSRFMQRLWMRILKLCPVMTQDEEKKIWKVRWQSEKNMPISSVVTTASLSDLELFEGSTESENIVRNGRSKRRK